MTADRRAALVETVARAIVTAAGYDPDEFMPGKEDDGSDAWPRWAEAIREATAAIDLIRAEVLGEAAKAAEGIKTVEIDGYDFQVDGPSQNTIAAAIRALKGDT